MTSLYNILGITQLSIALLIRALEMEGVTAEMIAP